MGTLEFGSVNFTFKMAECQNYTLCHGVHLLLGPKGPIFDILIVTYCRLVIFSILRFFFWFHLFELKQNRSFQLFLPCKSQCSALFGFLNLERTGLVFCGGLLNETLLCRFGWGASENIWWWCWWRWCCSSLVRWPSWSPKRQAKIARCSLRWNSFLVFERRRFLYSTRYRSLFLGWRHQVSSPKFNWAWVFSRAGGFRTCFLMQIPPFVYAPVPFNLLCYIKRINPLGIWPIGAEQEIIFQSCSKIW